ncbi:DNA topoisomerase I [Helicobacter sp. 13S00401-1]|nr:DNA topoisomerase I [Helicobacter sp. 13S00401-1]
MIVESPAKAKTIKNFLGKDYEVIASKGHIRDLPKSRFGITIKPNSFTPTYELAKDHQDVVAKIKAFHDIAETTYIATDEDREGEAIGFHIIEALKENVEGFPRIVFHEITKQAITNSLENPRNIDMDKVNAQQARRLLDRIVGFKLSGLLAKKINRGLSAGRVQSSVLKILVDREKEIRDFKPIDYYLINAYDKDISFDLLYYRGDKIEKLSFLEKEKVDAALTVLRSESYKISSIEKKQRVTNPSPPFMTSSLQQSASSVLGFSPTRTMSIAQRLYEGVQTNRGLEGVITYMRTDSLNITKEAVSALRGYIKEKYGDKYLVSSPRSFVSKAKGAQEAHEAIRPTNIDFTPGIAKDYLKEEELKLYTLIFNRFVATQMSSAVFDTLSVLASSESATFKTTGRSLIFEGFYKVMGNEDKDKLLPSYKEGEAINFDPIKETLKTTEPPARYSEASLIKTMESLGIGRPSTYAPTIKLLSDRNYIAIEKKQIHTQEIAFTVTDMLENNFNEIVDANFSAALESKLDSIASHSTNWEEVLWDFYEGFSAKLEDGEKNIASLKKHELTGEMCPECGEPLVLRSGRYGDFVGCSNYPKCHYIKKDKKDTSETNATPTSEVCEKCGAPMVIKQGRNGEFLACSNYPKCKNTKSLKSDALDVACPECGGEIVAKRARSVFYGCSNYPKCNFISSTKPINKHCEKCGYLMRQKGKNKAVCIKCKHEEDI